MGRPATPVNQPSYAAPGSGPAAEGVAVPADEQQVASGLESVIADDADEVNVPPPPMEYLGHTHHVAPPSASPMMPRYQSLGYKRTLIPILLTTGLCMAVLGACRFILPPDTGLGNLPMYIPYVLFGFSVISLVFGVLTMFQVKHALDEQERARLAAAATAEA